MSQYSHNLGLIRREMRLVIRRDIGNVKLDGIRLPHCQLLPRASVMKVVRRESGIPQSDAPRL